MADWTRPSLWERLRTWGNDILMVAGLAGLLFGVAQWLGLTPMSLDALSVVGPWIAPAGACLGSIALIYFWYRARTLKATLALLSAGGEPTPARLDRPPRHLASDMPVQIDVARGSIELDLRDQNTSPPPDTEFWLRAELRLVIENCADHSVFLRSVALDVLAPQSEDDPGLVGGGKGHAFFRNGPNDPNGFISDLRGFELSPGSFEQIGVRAWVGIPQPRRLTPEHVVVVTFSLTRHPDIVRRFAVKGWPPEYGEEYAYPLLPIIDSTAQVDDGDAAHQPTLKALADGLRETVGRLGFDPTNPPNPLVESGLNFPNSGVSCLPIPLATIVTPMKDATDIIADDIARGVIGKNYGVRGTVKNVSRSFKDLAVNLNKTTSEPACILDFATDHDRIANLVPNDRVAVIGTIRHLTRHYIRLGDCRLIEHNGDDGRTD